MLSREHTALVLIDIQGKLASLMHEREALYRQLQILVAGAQVLGLPIPMAGAVPQRAWPHHSRGRRPALRSRATGQDLL